ncbi:MAG: DNA polymerase III subunit chi [bacterium]
MTRISFYKIAGSEDQQYLLACKLVEKARIEGLRVLIHTDNEAQSRAMDNLLWSFSETAFLPHTVENTPASDIAISSANEPGNHQAQLINLSSEIPPWMSRFERAIEIVYDEQAAIQTRREHFEFYQKRGYPLQFHDLTQRGA